MDFTNFPFDRFGRMRDLKEMGLDGASVFGKDLPAVKERKRKRMADKTIDELQEEMLFDEEGNVKKDTRGVDYLFADSFWNNRLENDLPRIEQEFMKHCGEKLQEFNDAVWYGDSILEKEKPSKRLQKRMLRLIYNGAKMGDEYCRKLIIYMYKLYYKEEYRQLRSSSEMDSKMLAKIMDMFADGEEKEDWIKFANRMKTACRTFAMCEMMNITVGEDCFLLCTVIYKVVKNNEEKRMSTAEVLPEYAAQVSEWMRKEREDKVPRKNKVYKRTENFERACARFFGYTEEFVKDCTSDESKLEEDMSAVLAIMKDSYPDRDASFEEVQRNTVIYQTVKALVQATKEADAEFGYITGNYIEKEKDAAITFQPEKVDETELPKAEEEEKRPEPLQEDVSGYLEEIAALRRKVREKESEIGSLRELYKECKNSLERAEKAVGKYQLERDELIALREYAYRSQLEIKPLELSTLEDMKKAIGQKKIVIIGGHENWHGRLKNLFPGWLYVAPDAYKTVDRKMLEGKDMVYFFTDYLNHVTYGKFIAAVRENDIPFDYLGNTNLERLIEQIYEDVYKDADGTV